MRNRHSQLPPEAVEGREQEFGLNKRKKTPRDFREEAIVGGPRGPLPPWPEDPEVDHDARSRHLAANNRNFGVNLGVVFNFVSK
jgi:hypothetical protein